MPTDIGSYTNPTRPKKTPTKVKDGCFLRFIFRHQREGTRNLIAHTPSTILPSTAATCTTTPHHDQDGNQCTNCYLHDYCSNTKATIIL